MINEFTAIDFETAQGYRWSICQVGLVRVVKGEIVAKLELLVQPPFNYYWEKFTSIHGISAAQTAEAPTFDFVWPILKPFIENKHVVAHNSRFDFACLKQSLEFYSLECPQYSGSCTYQIYSKSLKALSIEHGIELDHHNALSDAMACSDLFLKHLQNQIVIPAH
jgi:DNA polymerase III subunit epsilon